MNRQDLFKRAIALFRADPKHDREAVALLHRALYESTACYRMQPAVAAWLGWAHKNGRGVPKDEFTALMWYRRAVEALRYKDPNEEWIKDRVQRLEARNPQPQPTPNEFYEWGLGRVVIKRGERYDHRLHDTFAEVTIPTGWGYDLAAIRLWNTLEEREEKRQKDNLPALLDESLKRDYPLFQLRLERGHGEHFSHRKAGSCYTLIVPHSTRFEERITRETIIRHGLRLMKMAAEEYLPKRLKEISERIGLGYSHCHISHGNKTLGSFYNKDKHIDLSFHLMKRTPIEVDAVIVHELCHGVEFNHDNEFHYAVQKYGGMAIYHADRHLYDHYTPIDI